MEFDIGNLFYIVITVVVIIVGILGKKKKPAGQGAGETQGATRPGFFENLEKAFNMGQEERMVVDVQEFEDDLPVEVIEEAPAATLASEAGGLMREYESLMNRRQEDMPGSILSSYIDMNTEPLEIINLEDEERADYFEIIRDFDAGTAVVYSAIINRIDY